MSRNLHILGLSAIIAVAGFSAVGLTEDTQPQTIQGPSENIHAEEGVNVKVYKNGELVAETENTLMEGRLAIENMITGSDSHTWDTIAVGNGSAPNQGEDSLSDEWSSCGLSPASGSIDGDVSTNGKWNLTATFDASCDDIIVNTTAQKSTGAGASEDYFAGAGLGRNINLYSGDSLTIEWSNEVT